MNPRPRGRVTDCTPEQARTRRAQARAFLDVAEMVLEEPATQSETHVAAALAVLAAIAATDAICGLRVGQYSRGQDHDQAAELLASVDVGDRSLPIKLRRVLASKDVVHYSPRLIAKGDAQGLVRNAAALVETAEPSWKRRSGCDVLPARPRSPARFSASPAARSRRSSGLGAPSSGGDVGGSVARLRPP